MKLACLLLGAVLLTGLFGCMERPTIPTFDVPGADVSRFVTVTGSGTVRLDPNLVTFDAVMEAQAPVPKAAWLKVTDRMTKLKNALESTGVRRHDMLARHSAVEETWVERNGQLVKVYVGTQVVEVSCRDVVAFPDVLGATTSSGTDAIENVRFGFVNGETLEERAREKAIATARAKAQTLAEEAQQRLGAVLNIHEEPGDSMLWPGGSDRYEFTVTVRVTFALSDF
jgi:uncharacterized protein YggE